MIFMALLPALSTEDCALEYDAGGADEGGEGAEPADEAEQAVLTHAQHEALPSHVQEPAKIIWLH